MNLDIPYLFSHSHSVKTNKPHLITISFSHFCEKARWALEWAGIPYTEERHLPVFHFWPAYRAAKHDSVPILVTTDEVLTDSTDILRWIDRRSEHRKSLYPSDPGLRSEVMKFEDYLDEGFGVSGRLWMYSHILNHISLVLNASRKHGLPWYEMKLMPLMFPRLKSKLINVLGITQKSQTESKNTVDEVFQVVEQKLSDGRKFLCGDQFTAADLTFASLSAAVLIPENYGVPLPALSELPPLMREQVERWREHPAGQFAARMYREFRRVSPA